MPQVNGLLELSGIERPPLAVAHAPSIRQCRRPTSAIAGQPFVSRPQADACMGRQDSERDTLLQVTANEAFPTDDCQSGHGVAMHGG